MEDASRELEHPSPPAPRGAGDRQLWGWRLALLGWMVVIAFHQLDGGAGFEVVDAWVAQPAREMAASSSWRGVVLPTFCGETRVEKSPGAYWATLLSAWMRGDPVDTVAARLPNAIASIVLVLTIFWLTRRIAGERAALFAAFACAASVMTLHWSHSGSSDFGLTTLMTVSLAALWIGAEATPPGPRQKALWMAGYFTAGLAMLYKMPMPLVCIGLPVFVYVLVRNRWRIFASPWHLLGLGLFLLPWLPWALAVGGMEEGAWLVWRVEYLDRFTGAQNKLNEGGGWAERFLYLGVIFLLAAPFSLSIPQALIGALRRREEVRRDGMLFMLIWFVTLLLFFTLSSDRETRYALVFMPPLFVMLGVELSAFFDPQRRLTPRGDRVGLILVSGAGIGLGIGAWFGLRKWYERADMASQFEWAEVWPPFVITVVILIGAAILCAGLYARRREHAAFGALVGGMWLAWLYAWPNLAPLLASPAPFVDFATQLRDRLNDEQKAALRQVAHLDPRIIWYSGVQFPHLITPLELLKLEDGRRDLAFETRTVGERMVEALSGDSLALFVANPQDYVQFQVVAPEELAREGRAMPPTHIWFTANMGRLDRRYLLFGNQPPPWPEPELAPALVNAIERNRARRAGATESTAPASAPASAEAPVAADGAPASNRAPTVREGGLPGNGLSGERFAEGQDSLARPALPDGRASDQDAAGGGAGQDAPSDSGDSEENALPESRPADADSQPSDAGG